MNAYNMFKEIDEKNIAETLHEMELFASCHGVYLEFQEEIMHSEHFDAWCRDIQSLMTRFGYFVLEHADDI